MGDGETRSDAELCRAVRDGDSVAWAALWSRHYEAGLRTARAVESLMSPEDLVSEAFVRIAETLRKGGDRGPVAGLFRPYLYVTIRSLAARSWRVREKPEDLEELDRVQWTRSVVAPADRDIETKLNDSLLAQSFSALPTRWQEVLWYTEVERLSGGEVGRLMGLKETAVAALAYRARRALRAQWIEAHVSSDAADTECRVVLSHLGEYSAQTASATVRTLVRHHLGSCVSCRIAHEDADVLASQLHSVLVPALLGVSAMLATRAGSAAAVAVPPPPALPGSDAAAAREPAAAEGSAAPPAGVVGGTAGAWGTVALFMGVTVVVLGLGVALIAGWQSWSTSQERFVSGFSDGSDAAAVATSPTPSPTSDAAPGLSTADGVELTLNAADAAGNVSEDATMLVDVTVPDAVNASKVTANPESVAGAAGAAEPGSTLTVEDAEGNVVGSGLVRPDGSFSVVLDPAQAEGARLTLILTDAAGNTAARGR